MSVFHLFKEKQARCAWSKVRKFYLQIKKPIILLVRPYPEPLDTRIRLTSESAMIQPDPSRPITLNFFKLKRRMSRIIQPEFEILMSQQSNFRRQILQTFTKTLGRRGFHATVISTIWETIASVAHRLRPTSRFLHLPQTADPKQAHRAAANDAAVSGHLGRAICLLHLRFPSACSSIKVCNVKYQMAIAFCSDAFAEKGAAPLRSLAKHIVTSTATPEEEKAFFEFWRSRTYDTSTLSTLCTP